ncbi:MAG: EAL domain-containing protein, partial [Oscillospiraceae bacterium]
CCLRHIVDVGSCADDGVRCIGLAEDVTRATLELDMIEHERDHDLLTGLINRRAFHRQMAQLFEQGDDTLKTAALVMMDLDNLKRLNDLYGHDCGDKYIRATAESFLESAPNTTIISRISGDEFYLFFYGYNSRKEILALLARLKLGIAKKLFLLPTQEPFGISVSGGVAWYPSDSRSLDELSRFSDFAMYKAKQSRKGELEHFDLHVYQRENYLLQNKAELTELIEKERIEYHFQPIVCARTGKIYAYEALMRANMPALHTPDEIITLARLESKLSQIETLTWFKAMEAFADLCQRGQIAPSCRVFINSMANQIMSASKFRAFEVRFGEFLSRIVLEFTEEERADEAMLLQKRHQMEKWHAALALDDYGSGYNSGKMLLSLSPKFIKVDLSIIRGIDQNSDKQKLVQNIVSYAHERDMLVVAEGIETVPEAETVIRTGADFLQGYFLARPASKPPTISEAALSLIDRLSREMRGEVE